MRDGALSTVMNHKNRLTNTQLLTDRSKFSEFVESAGSCRAKRCTQLKTPNVKTVIHDVLCMRRYFYLSHCYTIAWDRLSNQFFCLCICMCVCLSVGTLTVAFFNRSSRNLVRTFGSESEELIWLGSKSKNAFPYFSPKNQNFWGWIGISSQICKNFKSSYPMWTTERTLWVVRYDDVTNPRWRTAAILDFDFGL